MADWKDVTSYSQSNPRGTVEPKTWELAGSAPRIVVTRYLGAPGWYLRTDGLDLVDLGDDLDQAKVKALRLVRERLTRMLDSLPPSSPWVPIEEFEDPKEGSVCLGWFRDGAPRLVTHHLGKWLLYGADGGDARGLTHIHRMGPIGPGEG